MKLKDLDKVNQLTEKLISLEQLVHILRPEFLDKQRPYAFSFRLEYRPEGGSQHETMRWELPMYRPVIELIREDVLGQCAGLRDELAQLGVE